MLLSGWQPVLVCTLRRVRLRLRHPWFLRVFGLRVAPSLSEMATGLFYAVKVQNLDLQELPLAKWTARAALDSRVRWRAVRNRTAAWCLMTDGRNLSCAMLTTQTVLRWPRYDPENICHVRGAV